MKSRSVNPSMMIIDDDIETGQSIQGMLLSQGSHEITIICNPEIAVQSIIKSVPDLIFLDVPGRGNNKGLEVLRYIEQQKIHTHVVVISNFPETIMEIIHYQVFDFIQKPVGTERIIRVLAKLQVHKQMHEQGYKNVRGHERYRLIEINSNKEIRYYQPGRVIMVEADGNYSHMYMEDGRKETVTQNLGKIEDKLPTGQFIRISRKTIVNSEYIRRLNKQSGEMEIECKGNTLKTFASMKYMHGVNW